MLINGLTRITYCADKEYYKYVDELNAIAKTICACNHEKKSEERLKPVSEFRENIFVGIGTGAVASFLFIPSTECVHDVVIYNFFFSIVCRFLPIHNEYTHMHKQCTKRNVHLTALQLNQSRYRCVQI